MRRLLMSCVLATTAAVAVFAAHPATFVLRNGNRVNGELTYKGGTSYTLNGRDYPSQDIAVVAFVNDDPSGNELRQLPNVDNNPNELERHVFVMRDGNVMFGKVYNISADGETITFDKREGGRQDVSANQLARIYVNPAAARNVYAGILNNQAPAAVATSGSFNNNGGIVVNGNQPWTDTGIDVKQGDRVTFSASGQVRVATGNGPEVVADPNGAGQFNAPRTNFPYQGMAVGGLIARVGNGKAFGVGTINTPISMPDNGRLFLGINDDGFGDNSGAFSVVVRKVGR